MRYLREYTGRSKEAVAYEDEVTHVESNDRLVTIVSASPGRRVVAQFTRTEMAMIAEEVRVVDQMRDAGILFDGRRRMGFFKRLVARLIV
jgi:hypothetical protein